MLRLTKSTEYSDFELVVSSPAIGHLDLTEIISATEATTIAVVFVKVTATITIVVIAFASLVHTFCELFTQPQVVSSLFLYFHGLESIQGHSWPNSC